MSALPLKVGILGCTGTVGQRFILILSHHPWFTIHALGASSRNAGKTYAEAVSRSWKQTDEIPSRIAGMKITACEPEKDEWKECTIVFSGLDADVAGPIEAAFRSLEFGVFSNAKSYRRDPTVPLLLPLVNPSHLSVLPIQRSLHNPPLKKGFIVCNANCSTTALVVPLHALEKAFGPLDKVLVSTMQAISGAGYPGVSAMDIHDNVVPYIDGEEEKMEWEVAKIMGRVTTASDGKQEFDLRANQPIRVSASCNRVPVLNGHLMTVSVSFKRQPPPSPEEAQEALSSYELDAASSKGCPSLPSHPIHVHTNPTRPQPRLDSWRVPLASEDDPKDETLLRLAAPIVSVGRIRPCPVLDLKFVVLGNNVGVGAAGGAVGNAELWVVREGLGE